MRSFSGRSCGQGGAGSCRFLRRLFPVIFLFSFHCNPSTRTHYGHLVQTPRRCPVARRARPRRPVRSRRLDLRPASSAGAYAASPSRASTRKRPSPGPSTARPCVWSGGQHRNAEARPGPFGSLYRAAAGRGRPAEGQLAKGEGLARESRISEPVSVIAREPQLHGRGFSASQFLL